MSAVCLAINESRESHSNTLLSASRTESSPAPGGSIHPTPVLSLIGSVSTDTVTGPNTAAEDEIKEDPPLIISPSETSPLKTTGFPAISQGSSKTTKTGTEASLVGIPGQHCVSSPLIEASMAQESIQRDDRLRKQTEKEALKRKYRQERLEKKFKGFMEDCEYIVWSKMSLFTHVTAVEAILDEMESIRKKCLKQWYKNYTSGLPPKEWSFNHLSTQLHSVNDCFNNFDRYAQIAQMSDESLLDEADEGGSTHSIADFERSCGLSPLAIDVMRAYAECKTGSDSIEWLMNLFKRTLSVAHL